MLLTVAAGALLFAGSMLFVLFELPFERRLLEVDQTALVLEAADGTPAGRVGPWIENPSNLDQFPRHLVAAVLAVEDRRFYSHPGIDLRGIVRALSKNANAGGIVAGGSTITQQLVKTLVVGNERTLGRKFREALAAMWLELSLGKDEILTRYLNSIYLGAGAYGMPAAARVYFDKAIGDVTLGEAAVLAGLIRSPSRDNPVRDARASRARAAVVLDAMVATGTIDTAAARNAKQSLADATIANGARRTGARKAGSYFNDWVARHEFPKIGGRAARSMHVATTLDPQLQELAERIVRQHLDQDGARLNASQAALVAMRPNGAVVAMVGGRDYAASQFNRAANAKRQPGSAFKVFVYLAALRAGYDLDSAVDASRISIAKWQPQNYGNAHYGTVSLRRAFAKSLNTAAARLAVDVGLERVIAAARDLGITSPLASYPSLALGATEVTLVEMTGALASIRSGRQRVVPWAIRAFGPDGGALRDLAPPPNGPPLEHQAGMTELLQDVVANGTGRIAATIAGAAGKTGTSQDYRDAWFVGFDSDLVVGVWVGNDDRAPMKNVTGGSLPAAIWRDFMTGAAEFRLRPQAAGDGLGDHPGQPPDAGAPNASAVPQEEPDTFDFAAWCNVEACAAAYDSFRASDCTFQPFGGQRRICARGMRPDVGSVALFRQTAEENQSRLPHIAPSAPDWCNVAACSDAYRSFRSSDCSYQPYGSDARRICAR